MKLFEVIQMVPSMVGKATAYLAGCTARMYVLCHAFADFTNPTIYEDRVCVAQDVFESRIEQLDYWRGCDTDGNCRIQKAGMLTDMLRRKLVLHSSHELRASTSVPSAFPG